MKLPRQLVENGCLAARVPVNKKSKEGYDNEEKNIASQPVLQMFVSLY